MARAFYSSLLLLSLISLVGCIDSARQGRNLDFNQLTNQPTAEEGEGTENATPTRPDEALRITTYCACRGPNPILAGTGCEATCQAKSTAQNELLDILYLSISVDPEISLNSAFVNLEGWCQNSVPGNDEQNNGACELSVESTQTGESLASIDFQNLSNNEISFDITDSLANEQTYRVKIIERDSGAGSANSVQIRKKIFVDSPLLTLGPVGIDPINQYSCIINLNRTVTNNGNTNYISSTRSFFYYSQKEIYSPMPAGNQVIYCFDFINEGVRNDQDRVEYPRLETVAGAFSLWDRNDVRFKDNWAWKPGESQTGGNTGVNNKDDIIDLIEYEVYKLTLNLNTNLSNLFNELSGFVQPEVYLDDSNNNQPSTAVYGHYLTPLSKDGVTTYCPDADDYNATVDPNPIDRALGAVLGVETEALYTAEKAQTEFYIDTNGVQQTLPSQRLYINRATLDQISYYFNNDMLRVEPTQDNMDNQTIYFHWPAFTNYPGGSRFVQTSDQKVYRILKPDPAGNTGIVPKDGKVGCIPKSN